MIQYVAECRHRTYSLLDRWYKFAIKKTVGVLQGITSRLEYISTLLSSKLDAKVKAT